MTRYTPDYSAGGGGGSSVGGLDTARPAFTATPFVTGTLAVPTAASAFEVAQTSITLLRRAGASVVTQVASPISARTDWTNIANAQNGVNGTLASIAGNVTAARGGTLVFDYANAAAVAGRTLLVITQVRLDYYGRQAGTTLNNGDFRYEYSENGTAGPWFSAANFTGNIDHLTVPFAHVFPAMTTWAAVDNVAARVVFESAVAETQTADVDSVELVVTCAPLIDTY